MKYLLDTCVVSDFVKGEPHTMRHMKKISPAEIGVSSITVMEIFYGYTLNPDRSKRIKSVIQALFNDIKILDFTQEDAEQAGKLRAFLKQQGCPIGSYDVLLAGIAIKRDLILVSSNTKEFERVPKIKLEDWRQAH